MNPGRALDALVAEKVMGIEVQKDKYVPGVMGVALREAHSTDPEEYYIGTSNRCIPNYSTDIAAAWNAAEKLCHDKNLMVSLSFYTGPTEKPYGCELENRMYKGEPDTFFERGETAPHAICLAALKAVGVE